METSLYQTSRYRSDRLTQQKSLKFLEPDFCPDRGQSGEVIYLDPEKTFQELEGIGNALTEASAVTLQEMPASMREEILKSYFSVEDGGGCNIVRLAMNSCDFSLENYSCCDRADEYELETFSIDRDKRMVLPILKEILALASELKILISPWSPPAWMKTNDEMNGGGRLKPECRQVWADFFCRYIKALAEEGIEVWGLTINNEPNAAQSWDSMLVSAEEERDFIRDYLGPTLHRNGLADLKVMIWDHNRDLMYQRAAVVYRDPEASRYVWGTAYHWYGSSCHDNTMLTHDAFPDKKLFFSEGCNGSNNYGDPEWTDDTPDPDGIFTHLGIWQAGERYAANMIKDFNRHCVGWLDWNMVLNETGGPRHVPNGCGAPYLYDRSHETVRIQSSFWYLAHFFRFIKPGARRIVAASGNDALETTAFINPDGNVVAVVLNRTDGERNFAFQIENKTAQASIPPRSIQTLVVAR